MPSELATAKTVKKTSTGTAIALGNMDDGGAVTKLGFDPFNQEVYSGIGI